MRYPEKPTSIRSSLPESSKIGFCRNLRVYCFSCLKTPFPPHPRALRPKGGSARGQQDARPLTREERPHLKKGWSLGIASYALLEKSQLPPCHRRRCFRDRDLRGRHVRPPQSRGRRALRRSRADGRPLLYSARRHARLRGLLGPDCFERVSVAGRHGSGIYRGRQHAHQHGGDRVDNRHCHSKPISGGDPARAGQPPRPYARHHLFARHE